MSLAVLAVVFAAAMVASLLVVDSANAQQSIRQRNNQDQSSSISTGGMGSGVTMGSGSNTATATNTNNGGNAGRSW